MAPAIVVFKDDIDYLRETKYGDDSMRTDECEHRSGNDNIYPNRNLLLVNYFPSNYYFVLYT